MKTKKFYDINMAIRYLSSCIVRVDGHPVYVQEVYPSGGGITVVKYQDLIKRCVRSVRIDSLRIDFNPVPLGLFVYSKTLLYPVRMPTRKWKVGLSPNNCKIYNTIPHSRDRKLPPYRSLGPLITSEGFAKAIMGEFKDLDQALRSATDFLPCAFSRRFAVDDRKNIVYKSFKETVGKIEVGNNGYEGVLFPKYEFLTQALNEDMR